MPPSRVVRVRQALGLLVVAAVVAWPIAGDRIEAVFIPDHAGCAHSGDLADPARTRREQAAVLCLLNYERVKRGLAPLAEDEHLNAAAAAHAANMGRRNFFAHRAPDGSTPRLRIRVAGATAQATGENIAWGTGRHSTPSDTVRRWMNSPGHRANILRSNFSRVGTGIAYEAPEAGIDRQQLGGSAFPVAIYVNNFAD